jgi:Fic family protein
MEGNTLTYGHSQLLLLFDRISGDYTGREIEEMKAHDVALKMVREMSADPETDLSEKLVREINELILVRPFYNKAITPDGKSTRRLITPGEYKKQPNSVLLQDGEMFYYASPEETPAMMGDLIQWYKNEKDKIHPVQLAALFHYKLVRIHPFDDSNGRTTRLVMNYILMKNGYSPLVIESKKKEQYLSALNKADVGDINAFSDYIAGLSIRWQEIYLKAMKGEKIEESDDAEKEIELFKKDLKIKLNSDITEIKKIHQFSFLPLTEKLNDKLSKLNEFYDSTETASVAIDEFGSRADIYTVVDDISIAKAKASRLIFTYQHWGYKGSKNKINYSTECILTLLQKTYQIEIKPANTIITLNNNEYLSSEQIEELCASAFKKEFAFMKEIPV